MQHRQKIVFILPTLMPGGAERVLITLMNSIDRKRFEPEFIVINEKGTLKDWIASDIPCHCLEASKISKGLVKMTNKLNEIGPDIIVSTMAAMNFGVLLVKPFLKKPAKIAVREAVIPSSIIEGQKWPWIVKTAYKSLYPNADMVFSPAQCIIDEFQSYLKLDTKNYRVLHNPVDVKKIRSFDIACLKGNKEKRAKTVHFVCAGRLHEQKGFDLLINALPWLSTPYNWRVTILGEGKGRENLQSLINAKGLGDRVKLHGLEKHPWPYYAAADAFLLPSRWEGLPNVVLEALACGTPVISTNTAGGIQEIADKVGNVALKVVDTMDEFITAMNNVTPSPAQKHRTSLLPKYFHLENVTTRFANFLDSLEKKKT